MKCCSKINKPHDTQLWFLKIWVYTDTDFYTYIGIWKCNLKKITDKKKKL